MRTLLLSIDIGTQSTRTALHDQNGRVVESYSTPNPLFTPRPGWAEEDPEGWWLGAVEGIREVLQAAEVKPGEVAGIACDAQMHAAVPLGRDGALLSHAVQIWCDKRPARIVEEFNKRVDAVQSARKAGSPPLPAWWGFKLAWIKANQPDSYAQTGVFLAGAGYLAHCLTGQAAIDWSEASGSFLMDAQTLDWSPELVAALDLDADRLPPIHASSAVIGQVTPQAAAITRLQAGIPVMAGAGDLTCMLVASGLSEPGRAVDIAGTGANLCFLTPRPIMDPPLMNLHHALPAWNPFGISEAGGGSLKWFKDALCQAEVVRAQAEGRSVYAIIDEQAARIEPGCEGLLYLPYLMGERVLGSPYSRGVFFGLTLRTNVGAMGRAIMEGVAFDLRRTLEIVESTGNTVECIYHTGGGARSHLWSQIKADIYHKPVLTLAEEEGGILGSAILAGVGAGVFADIPEGVRQCVRIGRRFEPDPSTASHYDRLFRLFKDLHDSLQPEFIKLAANS